MFGRPSCMCSWRARLSRASRPLAFLLILLLALGACMPVVLPEAGSTVQTAAEAAAQPVPATASALAPTPSASAAAAPDGSARLYVVDQVAGSGGTEDHVRIVDAASGTVQRDLPLGYISPDWSTLFALDAQSGKTTVRKFDLTTGKLIKQLTLDGSYFVPVDAFSAQTTAFSHDGRRLVLQKIATTDDMKTWTQTGQPRSRFLVLDTALSLAPQRVDLAGNFDFDALSGDGATLYLLENLEPGYPPAYSPLQPPHYQVRLYDLTAGQLAPQPVADKSDVEVMKGLRSTGVFSPDGTWLYSLYTRPDKGPFIHALNLTDKYAICIDLPFTAGGDYEKDLLWSLALNGDGSRLYAVNGVSGEVAEVDTGNGFEVIQSRTLPAAAAGVRAQAPALLGQLERWLLPVAEAKRLIASGAVLSPDGRVLYVIGDTGLLELNTDGLSLQARYLAGLALNDLALSPDGTRLYVVAGNGQPEGQRLLALDPITGGSLRQVPGLQGPWAVLRVVAGR